MELTDEMLQAAMSAAVANGLIPKYCIGEDEYLKNWNAVKAVLVAALSTHPKD